jgi:hypothetical protein
MTEKPPSLIPQLLNAVGGFTISVFTVMIPFLILL